MFCSRCGKEILAGARFCSHCGNETAAQAAVKAPVKRRRKGKTWRAFTRVWKATCPVCGNVETNATARCPIDESPLVVAFEVSKWRIHLLPIHTAHVRCECDCGYSSSAVICPHDSTPITGRYLEFRPDTLRVAVVNAINILRVLILAAFYATGAIMIYVIVVLKTLMSRGFLLFGAAFGFWFVLGLLDGFGFKNIFVNWWPFRLWFNLDQAEREANRLADRGESTRGEVT